VNDHDAAAFGLDGGPHGDGERLWRAVECHADVHTQERKRALADFRSGAANVLVCSDIAARGLDFRFDGDSGGVDMVLQYDLATNAVDYLHRAGRAARLAALAEADGGGDAEAQAGRVVSLVRRQERGRARMLESVVAQGGDVVQAESEVARRIATAPAISRRKNEKMQRRQDRSSQRRGGAARSGGGGGAWRSSSSSSSSSNSRSSAAPQAATHSAEGSTERVDRWRHSWGSGVAAECGRLVARSVAAAGDPAAALGALDHRLV
jgi:superfamily II DNA/RNA helicase